MQWSDKNAAPSSVILPLGGPTGVVTDEFHPGMEQRLGALRAREVGLHQLGRGQRAGAER